MGYQTLPQYRWWESSYNFLILFFIESAGTKSISSLDDAHQNNTTNHVVKGIEVFIIGDEISYPENGLFLLVLPAKLSTEKDLNVMKIRRYLALTTSLLLTIPTVASVPSTQLFKTVKATASEANQSVFSVYAPVSGTVTIGIEGRDRFKSSQENHNYLAVDLQGKTAFITLPSDTGEYAVGLGTVCGTSISVVINTYEKTNKPEDAIYLPKVIIDAPKVCDL